MEKNNVKLLECWLSLLNESYKIICLRNEESFSQTAFTPYTKKGRKYQLISVALIIVFQVDVL